MKDKKERHYCLLLSINDFENSDCFIFGLMMFTKNSALSDHLKLHPANAIFLKIFYLFANANFVIKYGKYLFAL